MRQGKHLAIGSFKVAVTNYVLLMSDACGDGVSSVWCQVGRLWPAAPAAIVGAVIAQGLAILGVAFTVCSLLWLALLQQQLVVPIVPRHTFGW
jgi:hypothetical protein